MKLIPRRVLPLALIVLACSLAPACSAKKNVEIKGEAPGWAQETLPEWLHPFLGRPGLPAGWQKPSGPLAPNVGAIDHWQANHFVVYRPETAGFLYDSYTPLTVDFRPGSLPTLESIVARYTSAGQSDREKALALLTEAMAGHMKHPTIPPVGPKTPPNRNLEDEGLMASGCGWCNEQSRIYVRLCQIAGIPARMIYLFYADDKSGHVVSEFYADGHWSMADSSYLCVFPDESGRLLSAAELHTPEGAAVATRAYQTRWREIMKTASEQPGDKTGKNGSAERPVPRNLDRLSAFGVLNYPLPSAAPGS